MSADSFLFPRSFRHLAWETAATFASALPIQAGLNPLWCSWMVVTPRQLDLAQRVPHPILSSKPRSKDGEVKEEEEEEERETCLLTLLGGLLRPEEDSWIDVGITTSMLAICNEDPEAFSVVKRKDWPPPAGDAVREAEDIFGMVL